MSKITTLITGGAGFIGSYIAEKVIELGHDVIIIDDLSTGQIKNVPTEARFVGLDIGQTIALEKLTQLLRSNNTQIIFHCASIPRTQYSVEHPVECNRANITGTLHVLEAARLCGHEIKKIIHSSSCGVYGHQDKFPIAEDAPTNMGTPYSVQKYVQEKYFEMYAELYEVPSVMLRYFNVYGTKRQTESGSYPNVLAAFSKQKREHNAISITGNGTQSRDMIHVDDVVNANILAMKSEFKNAEVFNIGTGEHMTINDVAKYFNCLVKYIPPRPGEAKHLYADNNKAKALLEWHPQISYDDGIKMYLNN